MYLIIHLQLSSLRVNKKNIVGLEKTNTVKKLKYKKFKITMANRRNVRALWQPLPSIYYINLMLMLQTDISSGQCLIQRFIILNKIQLSLQNKVNRLS